jgi:hypothetical protein
MSTSKSKPPAPTRNSRGPSAEIRRYFSLSSHEWRRDLNIPPNEVFYTYGDWVLVRKPSSENRREPPIPTIVNKLGPKATAYAVALAKLVGLGNKAAEEALKLLETKARALFYKMGDRPDAVRAALLRAEVSPVNLDPIARWRLDEGFGQRALELLLWLWNARRHPKTYPGFNISLNAFDGDSVGGWWLTGRMIFSETYPYPEDIDEFRSLIDPSFYTRDPKHIRAKIYKGLWQRFTSFAPPPISITPDSPGNNDLV